MMALTQLWINWAQKLLWKKELAVSCWLWFFTIITRQPTPSTLLPAEKPSPSCLHGYQLRSSQKVPAEQTCLLFHFPWSLPRWCVRQSGPSLCLRRHRRSRHLPHQDCPGTCSNGRGRGMHSGRGHITSNSCCHISQSQGWSRDVFWYMINDTGTVFVLSPARPVGSPSQEPGVVVCKELVKKCQESNDPMPQKDWNASRAMLWPKPPWLNSQIIYKQSESSHKLKQVAVWTYFLFWAVVFSFLRESSSTFVLMYLSSDIQVASFMCAMCGQWKWKLAGYQKSKCPESVWQLIRTRIKIYDMIWFDMI